MRQDGLAAFRVVFRRVNAATTRHPNHQRAGKTATGAIAHATEMVGNLVEGRIEKRHELHLCHRSQARDGHANGHAGDA